MERARGLTAEFTGISDDHDDDMGESQIVAVQQVMQAVGRQLDSREVLPLVAAKARLLTGAESVAVVLLDSTRTALDFVAVAGVDAAEMVGQRVPVDDALLGHTALTGEVYVAEDLNDTQALLSSINPDFPVSIGVRSTAVVPIFLSGTSVGALAAINRSGGHSFSGTDVMRLTLFASAAAASLGQDRLRAEAQQKQRERDILLDAARAGAVSLNVQEVLQNILTITGASTQMSAGAVFLLNDERTRLYIAADVGLSDDERDIQIEADAGWAAHILSAAGARRIADTLQHPNADDLPLRGVRSLLVAPLMTRSGAEGLIVVGSKLPGAYGPHDSEMLAAVAGQAAVSLENAWLFEAATRRAQEATAIYELSQALGTTLDLDRVLDFVADSVLALLQVDRFALFMHNQRTGRLEIKTSRNLSDQASTTIQPRVSEGIAGWVMEFETPTAVQDVAADHRNRSAPIDQEGVTSLVSVPLQVGDRVIGVVHGMSSRRRLFTVGEMELLYTIANQAAAAIVNAQLFAQERQKKAELRKSVRRVARALGSSHELDGAAQIIADLAVELVDADRSVVYTLDAGRIVPRAASNFKSALAQEATDADEPTPAAWVARRRRPLMLIDIAKDVRFQAPEYPSRDRVSSSLGVPLKLGSETIGVLEVFSREPRRFAAEEVRSLLTFASQAGVGLKNAILVEQATARMQDLDALNAVSSILFTSVSARALCEAALRYICTVTRSDIGLVSVFEGEPFQVVYRAVSAAGDDVAAESSAVESALGELAAWVRIYGEPNQLPSAKISTADISALAVPVRKGSGATLAAIALSRVAPGVAYDENDRRFLDTAANLLSVRLA